MHNTEVDISATEALEQERQKWDLYYESLPLTEEDEQTAAFNRELIATITDLLPQGGSVLEAGCGGGYQSLALARTGRFQTALLDFSEKALDHARRLFDREGLTAEYHLDDAFAIGEPRYDLVFNAGVLEHYTFDEQVSMLRGLASRSRRYVLVLVPNSLCYWYWIWRLHHSSHGNWPFGKEVPLADLSAMLGAANLSLIGHRFVGAHWTETFLDGLGLPPDLRNEIVEAHHSPLIPHSAKTYLIAALGSIQPEPAVHGWKIHDSAAAPDPELRGALADALALRVGGERRLTELEREYKLTSNELSQHKEMVRERDNGIVFLKKEVDNVKDAFAHASKGLAQATDELTRANSDVASLQKDVAWLTNDLQNTTATLEGEQERLRRLIPQLKNAEDLRSRTVYGLKEYTTRLENDLKLYRAQRAWRIMLMVNKAYFLLFRRGFSGKLQFVKWILTAPFSRKSDLDSYDFPLVNISGYLPENLDEVIKGGFETPPSEREVSALPCGAQPQTRYDVIVFGIIDFDFRFQRPQQIAAEFARRGHRVFWISPARFLPPSSKEPYSIARLRDNIWEIQLRSRPPDIYLGTLEKDMLESLTDSLGHLFRDLAVAESCLMLQLPFWRQLGLAARSQYGSPLVYDCMDDWEFFQNMGQFNITEEKPLVRECDLLIVTGRELKEKFEGQGLQPVLVRNGADFEFFQSAAETSQILGAVPHPIVGYFGAIADWIDLDLVYEVARLRPQYSFVLVGQVFDRDVSQLESLANVYLLGSKPYADIPRYLRHFDVCTIPFLVNAVTKATDPVKLYEYFSQGKPVVATDMAELKQCGDLVYVARDAADFAVQLDRALNEPDSSLRDGRVAFARENTWTARVQAIDTRVHGLFPKVSVLIVTYNSAEYVPLCLDSIVRNTSYPNYEVIVVDNNSSDGTPDIVRDLAAGHDHVQLLCQDRNLGFAAANNVAARAGSGEYMVLLNADTMVTSGWIERLLRHMRKDALLGLLCPVTNYAGNEAKIDVPYRNAESMERFSTDLARRRMDEEIEIAVAALFCAIVRTDVWKEIGGLDESFQIGMFEDDDFSHRIKQAGYRIAAAEDCFIHHFGQGSFSKLAPRAYNDIFDENRRRFEKKWGVEWKTHQPRPNVKPAFEEERFRPAEFAG